jgi:hypothetical protein
MDFGKDELLNYIPFQPFAKIFYDLPQLNAIFAVNAVLNNVVNVVARSKED